MSAPLDRATARELERAEIEAWRDFFAAAPGPVRSSLGLAERDFGSAFALAARGLPSLLFNRVVGLGLFEPVTAERINAVAAHFADVGEDYALNVGPLAEPADHERTLVGLGFATWFHHVKWVRDTSPPPRVASALTLERVSEGRARAFAAIASEVVAGGAPMRRDWMAASVGRPGWRHYLSLEDGVPAGCAAMYIHGDVAWLGWGATLPQHRRKGSQALLFAARIDDARAAGCRLVTTETAPNQADLNPVSWRNAERAGFTVAYDRPSWIRPV